MHGHTKQAIFSYSSVEIEIFPKGVLEGQNTPYLNSLLAFLPSFFLFACLCGSYLLVCVSVFVFLFLCNSGFLFVVLLSFVVFSCVFLFSLSIAVHRQFVLSLRSTNIFKAIWYDLKYIIKSCTSGSGYFWWIRISYFKRWDDDFDEGCCGFMRGSVCLI